RNVRIAKAAAIAPLDIELGFGASIEERSFLGWDDARDDLVRRVERRLGALDFGTHEERADPGSETTDALIDRIVATRLDVLVPSAAARTLQSRLGLAQAVGRLSDLPPIDDDSLVEMAHDVFAPWLQDARGRADLEALDLLALLRSRLGWEGSRDLDRLTPVRWTSPGGREVAIDYSGETPIVSVRVQQVFGLSETPTVVDGAVPITFELLSPADRPIQVTADLGSFWGGSWSEVRKDMAGRYPKHEWPVHPEAE
ncbi:MAG: ATP-dependent helicase C-terminal domain-containing protein, partial [Acidimicrobiales bacterium]